MKTEKGEVVKVQNGRRIALSKSFCEKKGIEEGGWLLVEPVETVEIEVKEKMKEEEGDG